MGRPTHWRYIRAGNKEERASPIAGERRTNSPSMPSEIPTCPTCSVRKLALYSCFDEQGMRDIQALRRTVRHFPAGKMILSAGERFTAVGTVVEGWAFRFKLLPDGKRQIFSHFLPGDFITVEALQDAHARSSIRALTPLTMCVFKPEEFERLTLSRPALGKAVIALCGQRAFALDERLSDMSLRPAEQTVARFLAHLHRRFAAKGLADGNACPFALRNEHVADTLGLAQVHVARTMAALKRSGLVEIAAGRMTILNPPGLLRLSELPEGYLSEASPRGG